MTRKSREAGVTKSNHHSGRSGARSVRVSTERFRMIMEMTGTTNACLAAATGRSRGYVGQVRAGGRRIVTYEFIARAGKYLGRRMGEPGQVAVALIVDAAEINAGDER